MTGLFNCTSVVLCPHDDNMTCRLQSEDQKSIGLALKTPARYTLRGSVGTMGGTRCSIGNWHHCLNSPKSPGESLQLCLSFSGTEQAEKILQESDLASVAVTKYSPVWKPEAPLPVPIWSKCQMGITLVGSELSEQNRQCQS
jgi:hypothetical protein